MDFFQTFLYPIIKLYSRRNNTHFYNFENDFRDKGFNLIKEFTKNSKAKESLLYLVKENISQIDKANFLIKSKEIYNLEYKDIKELVFQLKSERIIEGKVLDMNKLSSHYGFLNALLVDGIFESITGISDINLYKLKIIDIGAGSGELELFLIDKGVKASSLYCVDISEESILRIKKMGISGFVGTLSGAKVDSNYFDLTTLSYFIEYDDAQNDTFFDSIRITKSGGIIVFEAWLPAKIKFNKNDKTVTRGRSILSDIKRIKNNFLINAKKLNKECKLEKISIGHRLVYSHYGLCKLPSIFLTFSVK